MKRIFPPVLLLILAVSASAQVKLNLNGYFSFDAVRGEAGLPETAWSLTNLRGGVIFSGELSQGMAFSLEPTFDPNGALSLTQAWAGLSVAEGLEIRAGLFLVPFGKYNTARRPHETTLIGDPYPVGAAFPVNWRELGLAARGVFGGFNLALFAGNGLSEAVDFASGQQFTDNNRNKSWGGRLGLAVSSRMELGASYYKGKPDADNSRWLTMWGGDASWMSQNIRAIGEYIRADIENPSPYSGGRAEGWFALLEFRWGQFIPAASFQRRRVDDPFHGAGFAGPGFPGTGIDLEGERWTFGLAFMPGANMLLKLEYGREREEGADAWTSKVRAQAAVHF